MIYKSIVIYKKGYFVTIEPLKNALLVIFEDEGHKRTYKKDWVKKNPNLYKRVIDYLNEDLNRIDYFKYIESEGFNNDRL